MSDENIEQNKLALLKRMRNDLFWTVLFAGIGWIFFAGLSSYFMPLILLGPIIIPLPLLRQAIKSGGNPLSFWKNYEVITTWSDGTKTTDQGAESRAVNIGTVILILIVGCIVTPLKIIFISFKYFSTYLGMKDKPSFVKSVLTVILILLMGFIMLLMGQSSDGGAQSRMIAVQNEHDRLNAEAQTYKLNDLRPENNYPVKLFEIRYRPDVTSIRIMETEANAVKPFLSSGIPDTRFNAGRMSTAFETVTPSGERFDSTDYRRVFDDKLGRDIGFDVFFPTTFTASEFDLIERSSIHDERALVFRNVKVNK